MAPILGFKLLKERFAWPLDGGRHCRDGRRVLGESKTARGLVFSVLATVLCGALLDVDMFTGLIVAATAMGGDIFSSFVKRRMGKASGDQALGLDQIPEVLLPLLVTRETFDLTWMDILTCIVIFVGVELAASRVLFALNLRKRPH
jgi:CDP-2,3-bis-(O-geranylgeranyl)-sn-glycerol synthase